MKVAGGVLNGSNRKGREKKKRVAGHQGVITLGGKRGLHSKGQRKVGKCTILRKAEREGAEDSPHKKGKTEGIKKKREETKQRRLWKRCNAGITGGSQCCEARSSGNSVWRKKNRVHSVILGGENCKSCPRQNRRC